MSAEKPRFQSQEADRYMLRLPEGLRDKVAQVAKANNRSMNAEFVHRIESSFSEENSLPSETELLTESDRHAMRLGYLLKRLISENEKMSFKDVAALMGQISREV